MVDESYQADDAAHDRAARIAGYYEAHELGRGTGIAQAILAVYEVLGRRKDTNVDVQHEVYMALMEAIRAIQDLRAGTEGSSDGV